MQITSAILLAIVNVLWQDPGRIESVDFKAPAGAVDPPRAPFYFLQEDLSGNSPKVLVKDASGVIWQVKGGPEGRTEAFVTRLISAVGYFSDSVCFIPRGRIEGIPAGLKRASGFIQADGTFTYAGFERRDSNARFLPEPGWTWLSNPFLHTAELKGLRILVMLVSDWDNKDRRDGPVGSNTGVLERTEEAQVTRRYYVDDWGQSLGGWGFWFVGRRSNWNCADYVRDSPDFVTGFSADHVRFGYRGQHTWHFRDGITVADVRWLMQYLGRVTDDQIRTGLRVSGANQQEEDCFTDALRYRIETLRRVSTSASKGLP